MPLWRDGDAGLHVFLEALERRLQRVGARLEVADGVRTRVVGDRRHLEPGALVGHRDGRAGNGRARVVHHSAGDGAVERLRRGRGREQGDHRGQHACQSAGEKGSNRLHSHLRLSGCGDRQRLSLSATFGPLRRQIMHAHVRVALRLLKRHRLCDAARLVQTGEATAAWWETRAISGTLERPISGLLEQPTWSWLSLRYPRNGIAGTTARACSRANGYARNALTFCITLAHAQRSRVVMVLAGLSCRRVVARPADDAVVDAAAVGDRGWRDGTLAHPGHGATAADGTRRRPAVAPRADRRDRDAADRARSRGLGRGAVDSRGEGRAVPHRAVAEGRRAGPCDGDARGLARASRRGRQARLHLRR